MGHKSDCSVNNEPYCKAGLCDCGFGINKSMPYVKYDEFHECIYFDLAGKREPLCYANPRMTDGLKKAYMEEVCKRFNYFFDPKRFGGIDPAETEVEDEKA